MNCEIQTTHLLAGICITTQYVVIAVKNTVMSVLIHKAAIK